jgi:hypothetical protein
MLSANMALLAMEKLNKKLRRLRGNAGSAVSYTVYQGGWFQHRKHRRKKASLYHSRPEL